MFGSLPTHVMRNRPWTTLLFRPDPAATHPNTMSGMPKDYLLMDLFTMPMVEPYAISEPFSTAGKINMNYQIMPYAYVTRSTALHAALKGALVTAVPSGDGAIYKSQFGAGAATGYRYAINPSEVDGALRQFRERFASGDIFRSAAEICDQWIVPGTRTGAVSGTGQKWTSDSAALSFWNDNRLTGDNVREKPYADLYARLTTKSNAFEVFYRVQSLQKIKSDPAQNQWVEGRDQVTGEKRGAILIERTLDTEAPEIPDIVSLVPGTDSLEKYYRFRIIHSSAFHP